MEGLQTKQAGLRLHRRDGRALTPWESGPATVRVSDAMNETSATRETGLLGQILPQLDIDNGPDKRGEYVCWCPFHPDGQGKPPHRPNLSVSARGYVCHACGAKGSLADLAEHLGLDSQSGRSEEESIYDYRDEDSDLLFQVCRLPRKRFYQRRPDGSGGWVPKLDDVRRVLYRLPDLLADPEAPIYVVEGERDADRLVRGNLVATTNPGGAGKWRETYAEMLKDRDVVILPDNDEPGRRHALQVARSLHGVVRTIKIVQVARSLHGVVRTIKIVELPRLPVKGDVSDWLSAGNSIAQLIELAECVAPWQPSADEAERHKSSSRESTRATAQADRLVLLLEREGVELFHDSLKASFARVPVGDHRETWSCRSKDFHQWLAGRFWDAEQSAARSDAMGSARNVIESKARFDCCERKLHLRVAWHDDAIWIDATDPKWKAIRVAKGGWEVVADPPILFRRHSHQRAMPEPVGGGDLRDLLGFVNLSDPSHELLLLVYVVCCFVPDIPHPIPVLYGPQGSAKTTLFRMLSRLIDPSALEVLSFPRSPAELVQQLSHHWSPFYDNISSIPTWVSDILCRTVTGEGFSKRELFSDDEDVIYEFRRCVGMNGVNVAAHRPDLLDRCILFGLESISPERRKPEESIWRAFEEERPRLLGSALDVLSQAMALRKSVPLTRLPRMADFALWGYAVAEALGYSGREFVAAYEGNADSRNEEALQASPVAAMVMELMEQRTEWEGTPTELLAVLEVLAEEHSVNTKANAWPRAAHTLTRRLNEVRTNLAAVGIQIEMSRGARRRSVVIRKAPVGGNSEVASDGASEAPSLAASSPKMPEDPSDAGRDGSDACDASLGPS